MEVETQRPLVCVLLYGDYPKYAARCLDPLFQLQRAGLIDLRIGLNEVSDATLNYLNGPLDMCLPWTRAGDFHYQSQSKVELIARNPQIYKYPMMRLLFHDIWSRPYVVWFDDDSWIDTNVQSAEEWLPLLDKAMERHDMVGSLYSVPLGGKQHEWYKSRPWYNGKTIKPRAVVRFCTGGFWAIRPQILVNHDWPDPELVHRGGDVALGELCRQRGYELGIFRTGVRINWGDSGKESGSKKRGFDSKPIGWE